MTEGLVSIVTPTLDRASYLRGLFASIRAQTYPHIEHIVVDGGSNDGTVELLEREQNKHDLRWVSEPDDGVYDAVNKGLALARGEIVAYLNNDDRYFPYSVEAAVQAFLDDADVGFVYGDVLRFNETIKSGRVVFYPPFDVGLLHRGALISQPTVFWRRDVGVEAGALDNGLSLAADIEYWNRIATIASGRHLDEVMAFEGEHPDRLTSGSPAEEQGISELRTIRARYLDGSIALHRRIGDRARLAYHHRRSAVRFLRATSRPADGPPGAGWQGFRREMGTFTVSARDLALALLPYVGRRRPDFVTATALSPTLTLEASDE